MNPINQNKTNLYILTCLRNKFSECRCLLLLPLKLCFSLTHGYKTDSGFFFSLANFFALRKRLSGTDSLSKRVSRQVDAGGRRQVGFYTGFGVTTIVLLFIRVRAKLCNEIRDGMLSRRVSSLLPSQSRAYCDAPVI